MAKSRLNTKTKRIGALIMWLGVAIVVLAALQFDRLEYAIDAFSRNPVQRYFQIKDYSNGLARFTIWIGAIMAVIGLLWSYLYDLTIGKVARWVETGSPFNTAPRTIAAPSPAARPEPTQPAAVSKPPSRAMNVAMLVAPSWLTITASIVPGFIFVTEGKHEALIWPALIPAVFTAQAFMRMSSVLSGRNFLLIALSKLTFAYLAFGIGVISAFVIRSL